MNKNQLFLNGQFDENDISYKILEKKSLMEYDTLYSIEKILDYKLNLMKKELCILDDICNSIETENLKFTQFQNKNVYVNIHPFINNMVPLYQDNKVLFRKKENIQSENYINASFVKTPFKEEKSLMIATQGPIQQTYHDFWKMVFQYNCRKILTLTEKVGPQYEQWEADCFQYWPFDQKIPIDTDQFIIKLLNSQHFRSYTKSNIQMIEKASNKTHEVEHIHFKKWKDYSVPENELLQDINTLYDELSDHLLEQIQKNDNQRLIVHCKAGVGRTGTSLAILNGLIAIKYQKVHQNNNIQLNIFNIVRQLREQRMWMVQTDQQYQMIFQCLKLNHFKQL